MTSVYKRLRAALPSWQYIRLLLWGYAFFLAALGALFYLFGQYLGYEAAALGSGLVFYMLLVSFLGAIAFGIALHLIDPK